MEKKITLIVFVLSSVLILSGFSSTEVYAQVSDFYWSETTSWTAPGFGGQVYTADAATNTVTQLTSGGFARIDDVEIDETNNKLYWNNWASGSGNSGSAEGIYRSNIDGTDQVQVTDVTQSTSVATGAAGLHGISLDPSTQTIYFTRGVSYADGPSGPEVSKVNFDGTGHTKLNGFQDGWFLSGIALSSSNVVYWGSPGFLNTATGGAINSVNADGTGQINNIVSHTDALGRSLALDESKGLIFYSSWQLFNPALDGGIWVYDINTDTTTQVLTDTDTGIPDVELDTDNMIIYWTDFARGEIRSASYNAAGTLSGQMTEMSNLVNPFGLALEFVQDVAIGGTFVPIDQSALLLAGVQSISMWMIPVVIAGIGIGVFVIKRRN